MVDDDAIAVAAVAGAVFGELGEGDGAALAGDYRSASRAGDVDTLMEFGGGFSERVVSDAELA